MKQNYSLFELKNGLRTVNWHTEGLVSYIGVLVNAGSRDEDISRQGLAHFVEHTIFKGTEKRKGWQISNRMEVVGRIECLYLKRGDYDLHQCSQRL